MRGRQEVRGQEVWGGGGRRCVNKGVQVWGGGGRRCGEEGMLDVLL